MNDELERSKDLNRLGGAGPLAPRAKQHDAGAITSSSSFSMNISPRPASAMTARPPLPHNDWQDRAIDGNNAYSMIRRRTAEAGFKIKLSNVFRVTGVTLEKAQAHGRAREPAHDEALRS
jgi:hypothetical protein